MYMSSAHEAPVLEAASVVATASCCSHLPATVTQGPEPKILYEPCVRPSGVRGNSSSRRAAAAAAAAVMVCCTTTAEVAGVAAAAGIATADKSTQTIEPSQVGSAAACLESDALDAGSGQQSNEEVHTTVEDAGEASDVDWSSEATTATAAAEESGVAAAAATADAAAFSSCDSMSTWPPVGDGLSCPQPSRCQPMASAAAASQFRGQQQQQQHSRKRRTTRRSAGKKAPSTAAAAAPATVASLRRRHTALPGRLQKQLQPQQELQEEQQEQQPRHTHMPLLEWSAASAAQDMHGSAASRSDRRAVRQLTRLAMCGALLALCCNLLLAAVIVLHWGLATLSGDGETRSVAADYRGGYASPPVVGHRLY